MSNGLKNIQSHARAHARRERLESGQPLTGYDDPDGALGCLTPVDDVDVDVADQSYSSPETGGSTTGAHSTPGGSSGSAGSAGSHSHAAFANLHHHHQQHHNQAAAAAVGYPGYGGYGHHHHHHQQQQQQAHHHGHAYSNSVSSTGTAGGYGTASSTQQQQQAAGGSGTGSQGTSPYMGHGGRLPSVGDMGIDAIINRGQGS